MRLPIQEIWRLGRPFPDQTREQNATRPYAGLRRWAHELGKGGHYATKSRRYSVTLGALRATRRTWATRVTATTTGPDATDPAAWLAATLAGQDEETTAVVIGEWTYTGSGWLTTGDAALALAAADAACSRRPALAAS
jgi:hypothetical protein